MTDRYLPDVVVAILAQVPVDQNKMIAELNALVDDSKILFVPPEIYSTKWGELLRTLQSYIPNPPKQPWHTVVANIVNNVTDVSAKRLDPIKGAYVPAADIVKLQSAIDATVANPPAPKP